MQLIIGSQLYSQKQGYVHKQMIYMRLQNSQGSDLVIYSAKPSYNIMATKISI